MNNPYLKTVNLDNLSTYYTKVNEISSTDTMLNALFFVAEGEDFQVFIQFKDNTLLYNINCYVDNKTIDHTYTTLIEKFYVCAQPFSKISEVDSSLQEESEPSLYVRSIDPIFQTVLTYEQLNQHPMYSYANFSRNSYTTFKDFELFLDRHTYVYASNRNQCQLFLVGGDSATSMQDYYESFERFYAVDTVPLGNDITPPLPVTKPEDFWLATDPAQSFINIALLLFIVSGIYIGFVFSDNIFLVGSIIAILAFLFYNVWVSTYLNKDRNLSREAFNEKYGQ
jgi:hypothetical protein